MANTDCALSHSFVPTEDLILSKPRRHFRATVHAMYDVHLACP